MTVPGRSASGARRGGRPTREAARRLELTVRETALRLFLENGYEATSMDAVASAAGTTKATLYARYRSKEGIFRAVLEWAVTRRDWPVEEPDLPGLDDLEGGLREVARVAVRRATHPAMVGLARIAVSEAGRFPDIARRTYAAPAWPRRTFVVRLLEHHAATGAIALPGDVEMLAELFLGLVSSVPARLASFGIVRDPEAQEEHTELALQVFLRSLR
jgi:AcrR family transcriptional regulator